MNSSNLTGLARSLVQNKLLQQADVRRRPGAGGQCRHYLYPATGSEQKLTSVQIAEFAAQTFGFPLLDLSVIDPANIPTRVTGPQTDDRAADPAAFQNVATSCIAMSDPTNLAALGSEIPGPALPSTR